jgi:hypothetical protein
MFDGWATRDDLCRRWSIPMTIEIHETTVILDAKGSVVRLQISDAPLQSEYATTLLDVMVRLPEYTVPPLLVQFQHQALRAVTDIVRTLEKSLVEVIRQQPHIDLEPRKKEPRAQIR